MSQQEIEISKLSPKVGDKILYDQVSSTIIAQDHKDKMVPYLLGWKANEPLPKHIPRNNQVPPSINPHTIMAEMIADIDSYTTQLWCSRGTLVIPFSGVAPIS